MFRALNAIKERARRSPVIWFWAFNGLRAASGVLLLPLLLRVLPTAELGVYYIFLGITALLPIIDFGFTGSVGRFVSFAAGGATELKAYGMVETPSGGAPNKELLWRLLFTYQRLYRLLSLAALVVLGGWGTANIAANVDKTNSPSLTWVAWGVTLFAAVLEIYAGWWNVFLRSMNEVLASSKLMVLAYVIQLILAIIFLLLGAGLLAVPVASMIASVLQRFLSRRLCLEVLGPRPPTVEPKAEPELLKLLWPTSWRIGLQLLSIYIGTRVPGLLFAAREGSAAYAAYGLSVQVMMFCASMAAVWTMVRWPLVGQYRTRHDFAGMRQVLLPALWRQYATYIVLAAGAIVLGPWLLILLRTHKQLLPIIWLVVIAVTALMDMRFAFWTMLLSTENRVSYVWATVATQVVSLAIFLVFWLRDPSQMTGLLIAPLIAGALFNYWYWPIVGARSLRVNGTKSDGRQAAIV